MRDPAPGLYETISGQPLPRFAELRARYGDPADLPPVGQPVRAIHTAIMVKGQWQMPGVRPGHRETDDNGNVWAVESYQRDGETRYHWVLRSEPRDTPPSEPADSSPRVDFRDMLKTDGAWSIKSRLEVALGRPYLATKLAEQLDPETGAKLCDRLEALLSTAYEQARITLATEVAQVVDVQIQAWRAEQERRAKVVTRERFGPHH